MGDGGMNNIKIFGSEDNKRMKKFYKRYRKEKGIPIWKFNPKLYSERSALDKMYVKYHAAFEKYRLHIIQRYAKKPKSYKEFKDKMEFFYDWDSSTKYGDSVATA